MNFENYLYLLGPVRVERAGQSVHGFESRRALALLCYLAAQGRLQTRAHLADLFWPDKPEARGRGNLSRVLNNINTLLPGCVSADRETVTFNAAACWLDLTTFAALLQPPADNAALTEAVALYRDDFMAGMYLDDCPDFETWLIIEREQWRQKAAAALHTLIAWHTRRGDLEIGLRYADRLLTLDPWREEAHRHKMLLLALAGQRSAALKQYEHCRQILADELGVAPTAETEALHQSLLNGAPLDEGGVPGTHPPPSNLKTLPLVGRAEAHAWLLARWEAARRAADGGVTLLSGPAGIGKTRLMREVTRLIAGQGGLILHGRCYEFNHAAPYQALYEALRLPLKRPSAPPPLPPAVCRDLAWLLPELRPDAQERIRPERAALFAAVAAYLRALAAPHRGLVLFLDDLHWADGDTLDLLHSLVYALADAPCWLVGTYRPEETPPDHPLARLQRNLDRNGLLQRHSLPALTEQEIAQLTARLLTAQESAPLAAYLYRESAGNPFIVTEMLAALRDQGWITPRAAGWEWKGDVSALALPARVQDIILQRTAQLTETSLYLLTLAAADGQPFDAALLTTAGACTPEAVAAALTEWQARQLVRSVGAAWDFTHDNIRNALYQNVPAPLRRLLHARLAAALETLYPTEVTLLAYQFDHAQQPAQAAYYLLQAGDQARQTYAHEQAVAAYRRGLELTQAPDLRYALLSGLESVHDMTAAREEQRAALAALADLATDGPPELRAPRRQIEVALRQAHYAEATGDYPAAAAAAERAVKLAQAAGDEALLAAGYRQWGYALRRQEGPPAAARTLYEQARSAAERAGAKAVLADALQGLANVAWNQGDYSTAQAHLEHSLALCQELGDRRGEADAYNIMGIVAQRQRDYLRARDNYTCALELRRVIGDRRAQGLSYNNLGSIAYELGDDRAAEAAYSEAAMLCREADDRWGAAIAALGLSWIALDRGELNQAHHYAVESLAGFGQVGATQRVLQAEYTLGLITQAQGDIDTALTYITQATTRHTCAHAKPMVMGLSALAQLWAARGDAQQAQAALAEAMSELERAPLPPGVIRPLRAHWHCYQTLSALNDPRAEAVLERARTLLRAQAAQLPATIANVFLSRIPEHHAILVASSQRSTSGK